MTTVYRIRRRPFVLVAAFTLFLQFLWPLPIQSQSAAGLPLVEIPIAGPLHYCDVTADVRLSTEEALGTIPEKLKDFIAKDLIPKEAIYFQPGVGLDEKSGMPYDHIRIRLERGIMAEIGNYTAASKLSLSIAYLVGVIKGKPLLEHVPLEPSVAKSLLRKSLETILYYIQEYPDYGGFLPWVDIRPNGTIAPATTKMPALDNGQLSWALGAVVAGFENSKDLEEQELSKLAQKIIQSQNYRIFYDSKSGLLHGTIQKDPYTGKWNKDQTYFIKDMFEGILAVLWGVLHGQIPESTWYNLEIPTVDYVTRQGEKVTTLLGFRASFHEHWGLIFLPLMETQFAYLYRNYLYVQTDHSRRRRLPGFLGTAYDSQGNYRQMGITEIAAQPVDREDVSVMYATAMGILVEPRIGATWLERLYRYEKLVSSFGAVESVASDGYADVFTADAKGLTILSASGGVVDEVKQYLKTHKVPRTNISMYEKFEGLVQAKYKQMQSLRRGKPVYLPIKQYALPAASPVQVVTQELPDMRDTFDVINHLQPGHLHGKNVFSLGRNTLEDDVQPRQPFAFEYVIPAYAPYFDQWAYRGTYIDQAVRIKDAQYLSVTIPVGGAPQFFEIEIKSDDIDLATVYIDTSSTGYLSKDKAWKTIVKKIHSIPEASYKLFNYISIVKPDPRYMFGSFYETSQKGVILIKDLKLTKKHPFEAKKEEPKKENPKGEEGVFDATPYWRLIHGDLEYECSEGREWCRFHGINGWRGGYLPYIDLEKFKYFYVEIKNLSRMTNKIYLELKREDLDLLGEDGIEIELPSNTRSYLFEIPIPKTVKGTANYFAISRPRGDFEVKSIFFSKKKKSGNNIKQLPVNLF